MKNLSGILALLILTSTAHADDDYVIKTKIFDGEVLVGSPAIQVAPKQEASVAVSGSYDLTVSIEPVGENTAYINTSLTISSEHHSPSMLVEYDKESTATVNGKSIVVLVSKVSS